jgi:hypothetical protein
MTYIFLWRRLANGCFSWYVSFEQISFGLLKKAFLAGAEGFSGMRMINDGLIIGWDTTNR